MRRHFYELRGQVMSNLDRAADQLGPPEIEKAQRTIRADAQRNLIGEILFSLEEANGSLQLKMGKLIREAARLGGEQAMFEAAQASGIAQPNVFNMQDPLVVEKLAARDIQLQDVNKTLRRRLARKMSEAVEQRQTITEIGEMVRTEFNFAASRSRTIAQTEIGAAVEESRHEGRRQAGVPLKSWLSSRKETGRTTHARTESETMARPVQNGDDFTIAGTSITCQHPRSTGLPEHDINCGCTTVSRYPDDTLKSVLDRYVRHGFLGYEQLVKRDLDAATAK